MAVDLKEVFAVRTAYNEDIKPQKIYLSLDEAKAFCDKGAQYGYVVYNLEDKPVYFPFGTLMASKIRITESTMLAAAKTQTGRLSTSERKNKSVLASKE